MEWTFATEKWSASTSGANILESYSMFYPDKSWGELWKQSENKSMNLTYGHAAHPEPSVPPFKAMILASGP